MLVRYSLSRITAAGCLLNNFWRLLYSLRKAPVRKMTGHSVLALRFGYIADHVASHSGDIHRRTSNRGHRLATCNLAPDPTPYSKPIKVFEVLVAGLLDAQVLSYACLIQCGTETASESPRDSDAKELINCVRRFAFHIIPSSVNKGICTFGTLKWQPLHYIHTSNLLGLGTNSWLQVVL